MALSLAILMLFLALGSGTAVWAGEATGSSTLEQHLEKGYVTQQDLRSAPHNVETEDAAIPAKYFEFVCVNHQAGGSVCTDLQTASISSIKGGKLRNNVPLTLQNKSEDVRHTFSRAHIGNTAVYFVGTLTIHEDDGTEQEYIYYTTDKNVTNKTVYAVLKNGDKITLEYTHGKDHTVEYQFKDSDGNVTSEGPDGWSLDQVFGADRPLEVANGHSYSDTVTIPRGYKATVTVTKKSDGSNGTVRYTSKLGEMMSYQRDKNWISLAEGSPDTIKLSDFISLGKITGDDVVTLQYEKIDQFTFDASEWAQTVYANNRMVVYYDNNKAAFGNDRLDLCRKPFSAQDHSFSWDFWGWTAGGFTWELDQLQINGEPVTVPMVDVTSDKTVTETTTLSTGTKITISVTSNQKEVGSKAIRYYRMDVENCYENLTVSAGNLVSHKHKELVFKHLNGVSGPQYCKTENGQGDWIDLKPGSLVERASGNNYSDPIRFKKADGYQMPHISYTKKDGTKLQEDDDLKTGEDAFVQYLIKTESGFKGVSYENWQASSDGYYYFCGTKALQNYMNPDLAQGVVLVNIQASPIKYGINYVSGAGRTQDGVQISPNPTDIEDMPAYQNGGENGYNCENHQKVLISNQQPVDKTGRFIFDHWEVLTAETRDDGTGHPTETVKTLADGNPLTYAEGESLQCSGASIAALQDCLYYDRDKDRKILTLRAVWKKRETRDAIPYMVNFYVSYKENGEPVTKKIKSRTHMVNPGARVVADLYQYEDGKKQLSANIQNVLSGDNETGSAYDGEYRIDNGKTTKGIDNVTVDNNTVNIYLVKVEKEDPSKPSDPVPAPPTDPSKPSDPVTPTDPSKPTDPSQPTDSSQQTTSAATSSAQSSSQQTADNATATGDNFAPILWIAIAAAALAGIGVVLAGSRRKKQ